MKGHGLGRRGRPPLTAGEPKRASFNTRLRIDLKNRLVAAASDAGRSLSEEIEFRLERSFDRERTLAEHIADTLGGPRMAALFRSFAGQAMMLGGGDLWLDNDHTFDLVRSAWEQTLDHIAPSPPLAPDPIAAAVEAGRICIDQLKRGHLTDTTRALYCAILEDLATTETPIPTDARAEFVAAATLASSDEKSAARPAIEEVADLPPVNATPARRRRTKRETA
jgi:hypothetical protein